MRHSRNDLVKLKNLCINRLDDRELNFHKGEVPRERWEATVLLEVRTGTEESSELAFDAEVSSGAKESIVAAHMTLEQRVNQILKALGVGGKEYWIRLAG